MKLSSDLRPPGSFIILDENDMKILQEGKLLSMYVMNYEIMLCTEEGFKKWVTYWKE